MTNTVKFDYNNKAFADTSVSVMNDILASNESGSSMDDLYRLTCKYAEMTREQFDALYKQASAKLDSWKNNGLLSGENCELNEEDLDMVVGGSIGSFFSAIGEGLKTAACAVGNFVKENAAVIGIIIAGAAAVVGGVALLACGQPIGAGLVTCGVIAIGVSAGSL